MDGRWMVGGEWVVDLHHHRYLKSSFSASKCDAGPFGPLHDVCLLSPTLFCSGGAGAGRRQETDFRKQLGLEVGD